MFYKFLDSFKTHSRCVYMWVRSALLKTLQCHNKTQNWEFKKWQTRQILQKFLKIDSNIKCLKVANRLLTVLFDFNYRSVKNNVGGSCQHIK
jgi:hypothetical protein